MDIGASSTSGEMTPWIPSASSPATPPPSQRHPLHRHPENHRQRSDHDRPHAGYGSAAKYVASTVREIALDASVYQQRSVTIVEIMGRHAGWLTAASVMARKHVGDNPLLIYLPESPFEFERFSADLDKAFETSSNVVVCVSEASPTPAAPSSASTPTRPSLTPSATRC